MAQPAAVLDDLEHRALAALSSIQRSTGPAQTEQARTTVRSQLEQSLALGRTLPIAPAPARLYVREPPCGPAPAALIVNSHDRLRDGNLLLLAGSLWQLGFVVLELDASKHHSTLDLLSSGVSPEGLIQRDIRSALSYLKSRKDVDPKRIGLVADSFAGTVAAALNPDFHSVVISDGLPDLRQEIGRMRSIGPTDLPDTCYLIPRLLQYAAAEEIVALIAPRPLLALSPAQASFDYAADLYRSLGAGQRLHSRQGEWDAYNRYAACSWLARWLLNRSELPEFVESAALPDPVSVDLRDAASSQPIRKPPASGPLLTSLMGGPLPEARMSYGLKVAVRTEITLTTQPGLNIPVTVLRPGPQGVDSANGSMIAVADHGRETLIDDDVVREAHRRGWIVWVVDPRGIGEMATNADAFVFATSLLLGESFTYRQAEDLMRILRFVAGAGSRYPSGVYARGRISSLIAAYVAVTLPRRELKFAALREGIATLEGIKQLPLYAVPFDALSTFDIPDLLRAAQAKVIAIDQPNQFIRADW